MVTPRVSVASSLRAAGVLLLFGLLLAPPIIYAALRSGEPTYAWSALWFGSVLVLTVAAVRYGGAFATIILALELTFLSIAELAVAAIPLGVAAYCILAVIAGSLLERFWQGALSILATAVVFGLVTDGWAGVFIAAGLGIIGVAFYYLFKQLLDVVETPFTGGTISLLPFLTSLAAILAFTTLEFTYTLGCVYLMDANAFTGVSAETYLADFALFSLMNLSQGSAYMVQPVSISARVATAACMVFGMVLTVIYIGKALGVIGFAGGRGGRR